MDKLEEIYGIKIDNPVFFKRALTHLILKTMKDWNF